MIDISDKVIMWLQKTWNIEHKLNEVLSIYIFCTICSHSLPLYGTKQHLHKICLYDLLLKLLVICLRDYNYFCKTISCSKIKKLKIVQFTHGIQVFRFLVKAKFSYILPSRYCRTEIVHVPSDQAYDYMYQF